MTEPSPPASSDDFGRIQILVAMGITAIALLIIARVWMALGQVQVLPMQLTGLAIAQGVGLGLGITLLSSLAYWLWVGYRRSAEQYLQLVLKPLAWADLIWLGLLPGLSEELLFRGVMLPAFGLNGVALLFSSLCFGVLHYSGTQNWAYVFWATAVGLMLGSAALLTGNLLVPILAHILTNLVSSIVWKLLLTHPNLANRS